MQTEHWLSKFYDRCILQHAWLSILACVVLIGWLGTNIPQLKLDASADSLVLEGDAALEYYREFGKTYSSEEFLLVALQPGRDMMSDEVLADIRALRDDMAVLPGVSSVVSILDVPLLNSPRVDLAEITGDSGIPTLSDPDIDRELVRLELSQSPIYRNLLTSPEGTTTALQVNLQRDQHAIDLLQERESLRVADRAGELTANDAMRLKAVEQEYKDYSAVASQRQGELVDAARAVIDKHRGIGTLYLGGVPMIAADMISFVKSDLVVFGAGIVTFVIITLAIIFRQLRWIMLPLITCVASATFMLGLLTWLDWRMTVISSNFIALLLIITLAIAIHLVVRYRELQLAQPDAQQRQLVRQTVGLMFKPCLYTSMTTIVAFVSLVVSGIRPVIDFGWMMTVGIIAAFCFTFVLLPAILSLLPIGRPASNLKNDTGLTLIFARATQRHGTSVLWVSGTLLLLTLYGVSRLEVENRFIDYFHESTEIYQGMELMDAQLGGTIPLDIIIDYVEEPMDWEQDLLGTGSPEQETASEDIAIVGDEFFGDEDDFFGEEDAFADDPFASDDSFEDGFGDDNFGDESDADSSFRQSYWLSLSGIRKIEAIHDYVDSLPETGKVLSLGTLYKVVKELLGEDAGNVELALVDKSLPDSVKDVMIEPYLARDIEQARISLRVMETSHSLRRDEFLKNLRRHLVDELNIEPEQLHFTGMLVLYNNMLQSLYKSQILTLGAVFVAIMLMFLVLFRSISLAVIAITPNLLAAGLVLGTMGLVGIPLDIMTITIAAIAVGIGVDHAIHYVHRFQREFPLDRDYVATMFRCHSSIGRAMYYTSVTVIIGFSILALSNFNPSIYFGLLTGLAMLASVIGSLMLLPQLIITFKPLGPGESVPLQDGSDAQANGSSA